MTREENISANRKRRRVLAAAVSALASLNLMARAQEVETSSSAQRPNIILIVADDLGFSDIGAFGGEIATPNLDRLAFEGQRYTNFYVAPNCSPTRSMLLTGLDNHVVGLGNMYERTAPNQLGQPGYEGVLRTDYRTIAEAMRDNGYRTYMAGKWHLGHSPDHLPAARGFDRSFALLNGSGSHYDMTGPNNDAKKAEYVEDGEYLTRLPKNYYSTRTYTDKIIDYIDSAPTDQPFFAYLAYQAPHDPIQAPKGWLRRYKGAYDDGWDDIREARLRRMKDLGVVPESATLSPRVWYVPEYDKLTGVAQVQAARRMEIYASVVEYLDLQVGRLLDHLQETGQLDNTIIIFFSDNGPNPHDPIEDAKRGAGKVMAANFYANKYETDFASWGRPDAWLSQGVAWAQVSATPFTGYKLTSFDGGVRSPLIVWSKNNQTPGAINDQDIMHVSDIAPTMLDAADTPLTALFRPESASLQRGRSWAPLFDGGNQFSSRGLGMEIFGGRAYREGDWKITWMYEPFGKSDWQLFNLAADPSETKDLADEHPAIRARLIAAWNAYAKTNNVIIPDRTVFDGMKENLPPRPPVDAPDWPRGGEANWVSSDDDSDDE